MREPKYVPVWTINLYAESVSYGDWTHVASCLIIEFGYSSAGRVTCGTLHHRPLVF